MKPHICIHKDHLEQPRINWLLRNIPEIEFSPIYSQDNQVIVLMEPYLIEQEYYSLYGIWADFLERKFSNDKTSDIKVIGIAPQSPCPNYLDMFFPEYAIWKESALPRPKDQDCQVSETLHLNGKDIRMPIRKLLKGHGKESFFSVFDDIYGNLDTVNKRIQEGDSYATMKTELLTDITVEQVSKLNEKWHQYAKYFLLLPPAWQLAPYAQAFSLLSEFVEGQTYKEAIFVESPMLQHLGTIFSILEEMRRMYVF